MTSRLPQLVAFDLDYTLWDLWIDTHVTGPLHRNGDAINEVLDKHNEPISFYRDVADILYRLRDAEVTVAACSRTDAPKLANRCLQLMLVPHKPSSSDSKPIPAINFFDQLEIYPGSKITHFKKLHEKTGIPYEEMLFFDDEKRNAEVERLGVTFVHCPSGVSHKVFEAGLDKWRKRHPEIVEGGSAA